MKLLHRIGSLAALVACATAAAFGAACGGDAPASPALDAGPETLPPLELNAPPIIAPSKRLDSASTPIAFDALRGGVWTANGDVGSISYVDVDTRKVVRETRIGGDVRSVALSPDFKWIAAVDRENASVTLVDGTMAFGPNLTPDPDTGLDGWSAAAIAAAIRTGVDVDHQQLCATMPRFADMKDDEAAAIAAYLRFLTAAHHAIPDSLCPPLKVLDAGDDGASKDASDGAADGGASDAASDAAGAAG